MQAEFERRANMRGYSKTGKSSFTSEYPFSGKLFCQSCGSKFRRQAWGSGKNKKYVWRCINREINGVESCGMKSIREKDLEQAFLRAMNRLISGKEAFLIEGNGDLNCVGGTEDIDIRLAELQQELMSVVRSMGIDCQEYSRVVGEIENLRERKVGMKKAETEGAWRESRVEEFKAYLDAWDGKLLDRFDGDLFRKMIEKVKVISIVEVVFVFKAGVDVMEIL